VKQCRTLEAIMVGRLGAARLGALSIGGSVVSVAFPVFNFFSYATTPMVARALAKEDTKEASRLVSQVRAKTCINSIQFNSIHLSQNI
jgi:Na+-driven multidrug efflux pump